MSRVLFFYIFRQVASTTFSVGSIIISALWIIQSLRFVELVLNADVAFWVFFQIALYALPNLLSAVLPIACFVSILFVYHRLIMEREIIAMEASGMSYYDIAKPTLTFATFLTLGLYALTIFVSPLAFRHMRDIELRLRHTLPTFLLQEKVFTTFGNTTVYIQAKNKDYLEGVFAHVTNPQDQTSYTVMAQEGRLIRGSQGPEILMAKGNRQSVRDGRFSILYFDHSLIKLDEGSTPAGPRYYKPYELPMEDVLFPNPSLSPQEQGSLVSEAHQRLSAPLLLLAFSLIGLVFLLLQPFTRGTLLVPLLKSIGCVIALQFATVMLNNLSARFGYAIFANYVMLALVCLGSVLILKRFSPASKNDEASKRVPLVSA